MTVQVLIVSLVTFQCVHFARILLIDYVVPPWLKVTASLVVGVGVAVVLTGLSEDLVLVGVAGSAGASLLHKLHSALGSISDDHRQSVILRATSRRHRPTDL